MSQIPSEGWLQLLHSLAREMDSWTIFTTQLLMVYSYVYILITVLHALRLWCLWRVLGIDSLLTLDMYVSFSSICNWAPNSGTLYVHRLNSMRLVTGMHTLTFILLVCLVFFFCGSLFLFWHSCWCPFLTVWSLRQRVGNHNNVPIDNVMDVTSSNAIAGEDGCLLQRDVPWGLIC